MFSQSLLLHLSNGVSAALSSPRPAVSLKGDKKRQSAWGQAAPCRGGEPGLGTPPSPTCTRNSSEGMSLCCPPAPGRTAPKGPLQALPSFLYLPGRQSSDVGRAWLGGLPRSHISGGGSYSGPPEPAWGGPGAAHQWFRHSLAMSGQLSFSPWSPPHSPPSVRSLLVVSHSWQPRER